MESLSLVFTHQWWSSLTHHCHYCCKCCCYLYWHCSYCHYHYRHCPQHSIAVIITIVRYFIIIAKSINYKVGESDVHKLHLQPLINYSCERSYLNAFTWKRKPCSGVHFCCEHVYIGITSSNACCRPQIRGKDWENLWWIIQTKFRLNCVCWTNSTWDMIRQMGWMRFIYI